MEAAARAAATPPPSPTNVIQAATGQSSLPAPLPAIHCTIRRLGGGMSTTLPIAPDGSKCFEFFWFSHSLGHMRRPRLGVVCWSS